MLKRDYLIKQFEEFGKVLGVILGLKKEGNLSQLNEMIREAAQKYAATEIDHVEMIPDDLLMGSLIDEKKLTDEQLKMLGDLLFEKAEYYLASGAPEEQSLNCYKKSRLIYSFLKDHATLNFSLDMHYKLELLAKMGL
jgi:hypothetical protein